MSGYDWYDGRPPRVDDDTSGEAGDSILPSINTLQGKALALVRSSGCLGMTCDELEVEMGGRHQTISARVRELSLAGLIADEGGRRKTRSGRKARVYVIHQKHSQLKLWGHP